MAPVVFDTNILIDVLKGYEQALVELAHWDERYMSAMTWMEILAGTDAAQEDRFTEILEAIDITVVPITESIMNSAAHLCAIGHRRGPKIHLPDAIIKVTATQLGAVIITRNTKDFKGPGVRVPYELHVVSTVHVINVRPFEDDRQT